MKKYIVKTPAGSILRRMVGSYIDSLPRLHKFASCIVEQQTDTEDEQHNTTTRIRIDPPQGKRPRKFRLRLFYVLLAYLFVSCAETPAGGEKTMSIQDLETWQSCDPSYSSHPSDPSHKSDSSSIDLEAEWEEMSKLAHAFAVVESNDNPRAVNHQENAVGLLQIRPIMVKQANQIVGEDIYTLSDRHDSLTSIAIFHTVMSELNPTLDVDKAIEIWNPNASREYRNLVKAVYLQ